VIATLKLISGNDDVTVKGSADQVCIDVQPWRDQGADAYLDAGDVLKLRDWLTEWLAAHGQGQTSAPT
jgi:hypothetical protein